MIKVEIGDISKEKADAIVNAPDQSLVSGGEVNKAIQAAAGPDLKKTCEELGGCGVGEVKVTQGFGLKCDYIIHTVGPKWEEGKNGEEKKLARCYYNCLAAADERKCKSIAFPSICTGMFKFPRSRAARIALRTVRNYLDNESKNIRKVVFVLYNQQDFDIFSYVWDEMNE